MLAQIVSSPCVATQARARQKVRRPALPRPLRLHRDDDGVDEAVRGARVELVERERVERRLARAVRKQAARKK
jgi:hypothetical protein